MKFQKRSMHSLKVMLCNKKRTYGRTEGWKDGRTNKAKAIFPTNFFEVRGIKTQAKCLFFFFINGNGSTWQDFIIFHKGDFWDFLFTLLSTEPIRKWNLLFKERILSRNKDFPLRVDPTDIGENIF